MGVMIELPPEVEKTVRQYAARAGQNVDTFVLVAVLEKIARARTFEEVCAPIAQAVAATDISDEEFDRFFEEAREEVWQEKHGKRP
jgi:hypothetical protein